MRYGRVLGSSLILVLGGVGACRRDSKGEAAPARTSKVQVSKTESGKASEAEGKSIEEKTAGEAEAGEAEAGEAEAGEAEAGEAEAGEAEAGEVGASKQLAPLAAQMVTCYGDAGHPKGEIGSVSRLPEYQGQPVFLARPKADAKQAIVVFGHELDACVSYSLGPAESEAQADLLGEGRPRRAFLASQLHDGGSCEHDACPMALVVEGDDGAPKLAARTEWSCDSATVETVQIFEDRETLEVRCTSMSGPDSTRHLALFHVVDEVLTPVLAVDIGAAAVEPSDDGKSCTLESEGKVEVTAKGATPMLDVLEIAGPSEGTKAIWVYSAKEQRFLSGTGTSVEIQARRECEP